MDNLLGRVVAVSGSQITATLDHDDVLCDPVSIGALVKACSAGLEVVGTVASIQTELGDTRSRRSFVVDLLGEIALDAEGGPQFRRGVSRYPVCGTPVRAAADADFTTVYARLSQTSIAVGTLYHDPRRPAFVLANELLAKNFALLGASGSGKSCAVTLLLSGILARNPNAHIVLLDPHNEYSAAFTQLAEIVNVDNLDLPFWLLDYEEAVGVLVRGGTAQEQQAQAIILKEAITKARRRFAGDDLATSSITVDTPVPYKASDLFRFIDEAMGKLDNPDTSAPYLRLRTRLDSFRHDRRFAFMFSDRLVTRDTLSHNVGRLLRIPVDGKPLTIIDLSGIPSEIADVVVSLTCRLTFDFALWSDRDRMPPLLLVCEEAHRYVPANPEIGFAAAGRTITRLAREGRKYGISLALVTQLPSELSPQALSQCGTIFALRLGHYLDQRFMETALPDAARGMLAALPSLRTQEAIIFGEGVPLPLRVRFHDLPGNRRPRSESADFSAAWQTDNLRTDFVDEGVRRWREQSRTTSGG
ncbi:MAG TPA: ATP-binding protein [Stellaceae bacterium]|jgi:DNA helicase HerA-like ATPase|nr:ATP-binding protein [Stellaceae bacterium]